MREVIADLNRIEGVQWVLLTGQDGLSVASHGIPPGPEDADEDLKAALSAAIYGTIQRALARIEIGTLSQTIIETESHVIQLMGLGDLLLVVVADRKVNSGLVRVEMRRAARRIERYLHRLEEVESDWSSGPQRALHLQNDRLSEHADEVSAEANRRAEDRSDNGAHTGDYQARRSAARAGDRDPRPV